MSENRQLWWLAFFGCLAFMLLMGWGAKAGSIQNLSKLHDDSISVNFRDGTQSTLAPISEWVKFIPSCTWTTNVTWTGRWRRVGSNMEIRFQGDITGAPGPGVLDCDLPSGFTIDTAALPNTETFQRLGKAVFNDGFSLFYLGDCAYRDNNSIRFANSSVSGSKIVDADTSPTNPFTFASGDDVNAICSIPVNW